MTRFWIKLGFGFLFALLTAGGSRADDGAALARLVAAFYVPYLTENGPEPPAAVDVIAAHATPRLRALIAALDECETREQGVCSLDFDVIIDGQDWDLKAPPVVRALPTGLDEMTVSSRFDNDGAKTEVDYQFMRLGGAWLINDVTDIDPDGTSQLSTVLRNEP